MNKIYQKLSDARRALTPLDVDYEVKTQTHNLKPLSKDGNVRPKLLRLYTDGSTLISRNNRRESTFSGWGMHLMSFEDGKRRKVGAAHGCILNGSPLISELAAIKKGLEFVDKPSCVSIVCDSTDAIKSLMKIENADKELKKINAQPPKDRAENEKLQKLKILSEIKKLMSSENVVACEIKWQPSHTVEKADVTMNELHDAINSENDPSIRLFLLDAFYNQKADDEAGKGSEKAVRVSLLDLKSSEDFLRKKGMMHLVESYLDKSSYVDFSKVVSEYGKSALSKLRSHCRNLNQASRHIHGSRKAKEVAIDFFADNLSDYVTPVILDKIFTESEQNKINKRRELLNIKGIPSRGSRESLASVAEKAGNFKVDESHCLKTEKTAKQWADRNIGRIKEPTNFGVTIR